MIPFDFQSRTRIVFGPGRIAELGALAAEVTAAGKSRSPGDGSRRRALVVSDPGVVAAGHTERGEASLAEAGFETCRFDHFGENPNTNQVDLGVEAARQFTPDLIVGLGGGSSMDCAKGINFLYSCGGKMQDYWGVGKATGELLPMIATPTTAGTGSETQSFALISDADTKAKMACGDKRAAFRLALLDPELTLTQPARVTALSGYDALAHAVETAVTRVRTTLSMVFSCAAWKLLAPAFLKILDDPGDLEARANMQCGACLAGLAIENSMLGAGHALANPLTAQLGITHGEAVATMLPHVVRANGRQVGSWYRDLLETTAPFSQAHPALPGPGADASQLAEFLEEVARRAGLAGRLSQQGVPRQQLARLAHDAASQWTGKFNPIAFSEQQLTELYEAAY
jgi:alcohol dehydrogenase